MFDNFNKIPATHLKCYLILKHLKDILIQKDVDPS